MRYADTSRKTCFIRRNPFQSLCPDVSLEYGMLEKYYRKRIQAGRPCDDGEHCWMVVKSNRLVYVTATVVICRGRGMADDINGQIGLIVHANVKEHSYRV